MNLIGKIDSSSGKKSIYGYLIDTENPEAERDALIKIDSHEFIISCNLHKNCLKSKYDNCNHGFKLEIPLEFKDSKFHTIELYDKEKLKLVDSLVIPFKSSHIVKKDVKPLVSIIIPVYNVAKVLGKTLYSIVNQTFTQIEIIVVNDCSPDDSDSIIKKFMNIDKRIKYIKHDQNLSSSQARKNGVSIAQGKYVMFVDGDDELTPNCVEIAYDTIEKKKVDIVNFGTQVINCGNMKQARIDMNQRMLKPHNGVISGDIQKACFIDKKFSFNIWNKIYKADICKKAFESVEDGNFPKAQDLYAFFYISKFATSYYGIDDQLYKYNFGLGVTGGDSIDIPRFKKLISESWVINALKRDQTNTSDTGKQLLEKITNDLINECFAKFDSQLETDKKDEGFKLLLESFGGVSLASYLAKKYWYQRIQIGEKLKNFSTFKQGKKEIKTIALYYDTLSNGGAQRVTVQIANLLSKYYQVIIISDDKTRGDTNEYSIKKEIIHDYISDLESSRVDNYSKRASRWKELIDKYNIDLFITGLWLNPITFWDIVTLKLCNIKVIIHAHNTCALPYKIEDQTSFDLVYRYMLVDGVVALSKCDQFFISSFNKNCIQICNPPLENSLNVSHKKNSNGMNIVWVGRISNEKKPLDAIMMMEKLVKKLPQAHLYIVGGGNESLYQKMQELINQKDLSKNVSLEGFTLDVSKYYSKSDVFICTSEYEGWSLTIGEAMAYHLPIVSYDMPYLEFFIDGRGIVSVPMGDYVSLASNVEKILTNQDLLNKLGEESYTNILDKNQDDISGKWNTIISNISNAELKGINDFTIEEIYNYKSTVFFYITEFQNKVKDSLLKEKLKYKKIIKDNNLKI